MINGAHVVLYTRNPNADRAFFRDVLHLSSIDAGHGWLIFALPPAEAAFHDSDKHDADKHDSDNDDVNKTDSNKAGAAPASAPEQAKQDAHHELFLMCDDIAATLRDLKAMRAPVSAVSEQRWGKLATLTLPGGSKLGIYEPKHPRPSHP